MFRAEQKDWTVCFILFHCTLFLSIFSYPLILLRPPPIVPVITIPCQFALSTNLNPSFKCHKKSFLLFPYHATPKMQAPYFSESHTCPPKNVYGVTCRKTEDAADIQVVIHPHTDTHTFTICNSYYSSTAKMVSRMPLNFTFYVYCLSYLL